MVGSIVERVVGEPYEVAGLGRLGVTRIPPSEMAQDELVLGPAR